MPGPWGGYKNGQIPYAAMKQVAPGKYLKPDVADAWLAAVAEAGRHGIRLTVQEAYRPLGVPADQYVTDEKKTSTGNFNQWYAYGIYKRGGPLAATPGYSNHGWAMACDTTPGRENAQLAAIMKSHNFSYDINSETWHADFVGVSPAPKPTPTPKPQPAIPDASTHQKHFWDALQGYLKTYWGYTGALDGKPGTGTWSAVQRWLKAKWGYTGALDGKPGSGTYAAMARAGSPLR